MDFGEQAQDSHSSFLSSSPFDVHEQNTEADVPLFRRRSLSLDKLFSGASSEQSAQDAHKSRKDSFDFGTHLDDPFVNSVFLQENGETRRDSIDDAHLQQLQLEQQEREKALEQRPDMGSRLGMFAAPTPSLWSAAFSNSKKKQSEGHPDDAGSNRNPYGLFDDFSRVSSAESSQTQSDKKREKTEKPYFPPPPSVDPSKLPFPPVFMANFSHRHETGLSQPASRKRPRPDNMSEPRKQEKKKRQATGANMKGDQSQPHLEKPCTSNNQLMKLVEGFFQEPKEKVLSGKTNKSPVHPHRVQVNLNGINDKVEDMMVTASIHGYHKLTKTKTESLGTLQTMKLSGSSDDLINREEQGKLFVTFKDMVVTKSSHNHGQKLFIRFSLINSEGKSLDHLDSADFSTITRRGVEKRKQKKTKEKLAKIELLEKGIHTPTITGSDPAFIFTGTSQIIKLYGKNFGALQSQGLKVNFGNAAAHDVFSVRPDMILVEVGSLKEGNVRVSIEQNGKEYKSDHTITVLPKSNQNNGHVQPVVNGTPFNNHSPNDNHSTSSPKCYLSNENEDPQHPYSSKKLSIK